MKIQFYLFIGLCLILGCEECLPDLEGYSDGEFQESLNQDLQDTDDISEDIVENQERAAFAENSEEPVPESALNNHLVTSEHDGILEDLENEEERGAVGNNEGAIDPNPWPDGIVPWFLDRQSFPGFVSGVGGGYTTAVLDQMEETAERATAELETKVPGLDFVKLTAPPISGAWVNIQWCGSTDCNSSATLGYRGPQQHNLNTQKNQVPDWGNDPANPYAEGMGSSHIITHEMLHVLGIFHEQVREDTGEITINWGSLEGCPADATQISHCFEDRFGGDVNNCAPNYLSDCGCSLADLNSGDCGTLTNFATVRHGIVIDPGGHDFDSLMHYGPRRGIKTDPSAVWAGMPDTITSNIPGQVITSQRDHLSAGDIFTLNAMYPVAKVSHNIVIKDSGFWNPCELQGADDDIANEETAMLDSNKYPDMVFPDGEVDTSLLAVGTFWDISCEIRSYLWGPHMNNNEPGDVPNDDYMYPNYIEDNPNGSGISHSSEWVELVVVSPSLIPIISMI